MNPNLAKEVFEYHNKLRANPQMIIPLLEQRLACFKGNILHLPGCQAVTTKEGADSVKGVNILIIPECIEYLKQ